MLVGSKKRPTWNRFGVSMPREFCGFSWARGHNSYFGEAVSQTEHALQSAWLAAQSGAPDHLVMAAPLHDIGNLLHGLPEDIAGEDIAEKGIDDRHEAAGHE